MAEYHFELGAPVNLAKAEMDGDTIYGVLYEGNDGKQYFVNVTADIDSDEPITEEKIMEDTYVNIASVETVIEDGGIVTEITTGTPESEYANGDIRYIKLPAQYEHLVDRPAEFSGYYKIMVSDTDTTYAAAQIIYKDGSYGPRFPMFNVIGKTGMSLDPDPHVISISVDASEAKTEYDLKISGVADWSGLVVTAMYSDGTSEVITDGYTVSPVADGESFTENGNYTMTVTYQGLTDEFSVTVVISK